MHTLCAAGSYAIAAGRRKNTSSSTSSRSSTAQGESEFNRGWFPCHDFPNERQSTELVVDVPEGARFRFSASRETPVTGSSHGFGDAAGGVHGGVLVGVVR